MPLHGAGDPETIDVEPAVCLNRHPGVFCRDVFDEALSPLLAAVKDKALVKALPQPLLFGKALLAGHGAADVLPVNVFFGDVDIVHSLSAFFLFQTRFQKRHKGSLA